ncbi:hypothetical protein [Planctomicrobium sp. SH527]|uniref:hypothetical protein n=1 Tax=Planctomicrobium sp. SH527 TaxID=3448123 RepID=UPI003F5B75AB
MEMLLSLLAEEESWTDWLNPKKWLDTFIKSVFKGVKRFFCWVILQGLDWATSLAQILAGFLPTMPDVFVQLAPWFAQVNAWIPIDTFLWCFVTYLTVCASIAALRFVKSWIPTLGG